MPRRSRVLVLCLFVLLGVSVVASVGITMRLNYLFVVSMIEDAEKKLLIGWGTVVADLWKASGLIFAPLLWRAKNYAAAISAAVVWALCFVWAVASLLGSVAHERMATTAGRDSVRAAYADAEKELAELELKRNSLRATRPSAEVEALIAGALARTVTFGARVRTVDDVSKNCTRPERLTAAACTEISELRTELAAAVEARRLEEQLSETRQRVATLRERGANQPSDVQGEFIARMSRGLLSIKDAALGLPLLVTSVFEAIGALCPAILYAVAEGSVRAPMRVQTRPGASGRWQVAPPGLIVDFLDDCTEPRSDEESLSLGALYAAYQIWCDTNDKTNVVVPDFITDLDHERQRPEMRDRVRKVGDRYHGIGLIPGSVIGAQSKLGLSDRSKVSEQAAS